MRTNVVLDEKLVQEAFKYAGGKPSVIWSTKRFRNSWNIIGAVMYESLEVRSKFGRDMITRSFGPGNPKHVFGRHFRLARFFSKSFDSSGHKIRRNS
jgi:hypothetical protein